MTGKHGVKRARLFELMLFVGLLGFEVINFASTEHGLTSLIGGNKVGPWTWARFLAMAFCVSDLIGMARILTPETGRNEKAEVIVLFLVWLGTAAINALLNWFTFTTLMSSHPVGNALISPAEVITYGPALLATAILLIRVGLVAALSTALDGQSALLVGLGNMFRGRSKVHPKAFQPPKAPTTPAVASKPTFPTFSLPTHDKTNRG